MSIPEPLLRIDDHALFFEPPDLLIFDLGAKLDGKSAKSLIDVQAEVARGKSHLLLLCRFSPNTNIDAGARAAVISRSAEMPPLGLAVVGAPFRGRVIVDMIFRALRILGNQRTYTRLFD